MSRDFTDDECAAIWCGDLDLLNELSAKLYALEKDTPGKVWSAATEGHPAIARALRVNPTEDGACFALTPFRLARMEQGHRILAAYPAPRMLGPLDLHHDGIEQVIAWGPVSNSATLLADPDAQLVGRWIDSDAGTLFADPRAFFQAWAMERAAFYVRWREAALKEWSAPPQELDLVPGKLIVGDAAKVRWNPSAMPGALNCVGIDPAKLNKLLLRAAHVPRCHAGMRAAA